MPEPGTPAPPAEPAAALAEAAPTALAGPAEGDLDLGVQITLDAFSGPLDLLLFLVRRAEVDIADIALAEIADQYIAVITQATADSADIDLEQAGEFVLMAATLLEIKARMVMPAPAGTAVADEADAIDPRAGLVRQLLAYRRTQDASDLLLGLELAQAERLPRQLRELIPEDPEEVEGISLSNCDAGLLFDTWQRLLARIGGLGPRTVLNDDQPIEARMTALVDVMRSAREARLSWLFEREPRRIGRVGILMATLECTRQCLIETHQYEQFGDVFLRLREGEQIVLQPTAEAPEEPKRRRRRPPLVTWQAPAQPAQPASSGDPAIDAAAAMAADVAPASADDEPELLDDEPAESDEQRFVRELEEATRVDAVLRITADLDAGFAAFTAEQARIAEEIARSAADPAAAPAAPDATLPTPEPVLASAPSHGAP